MLTFLLQIYCPIDESLNDRVIYLFVCINSDCHQNKCIALRFITPFIDIDINDKKDSQIGQQSNEWIESETDWDYGQHLEHIEDNPTIESISKESIDSKPQKDKCLPISDQSLAFFRPFYVTVIDEPQDSYRDDKHINQLLQSYERQKTKQNSDKSNNYSIETYEQNYINSIYGNDRISYQFFKRLSLCPQQIIRYEWEGMPLLNSNNCKPIISKCDLCSSDRSFEMQLMPALLSYLKPLSGKPNVGFDFGTVLIYSCSKNCNKKLGSFAIEQCIVFADNDIELINRNQLNNN